MYPVSSIFRLGVDIAARSFTLAGGDIVQTVPETLSMYRKCWKNRTLTPVCFFYAMAR
jgi:hypothetical protein